MVESLARKVNSVGRPFRGSGERRKGRANRTAAEAGIRGPGKRVYRDNRLPDVLPRRTARPPADGIRPDAVHPVRCSSGGKRGKCEDEDDAFRALLKDDKKLTELAARCTMDMISRGYRLGRMVTKQEVIEATEKTIAQHSGPDEAQRDYIQALE